MLHEGLNLGLLQKWVDNNNWRIFLRRGFYDARLERNEDAIKASLTDCRSALTLRKRFVVGGCLSITAMGLIIFLIVCVVLTACEGKYEDNEFRYVGPPAPLAEDGRVIDTPEVAHARAMHLAAHAEALRRLAQVPTPPDAYEDTRGNDGVYHDTSYVSSIASRNYIAPIVYNGRVMDTQEVARTKTAHLSAYNQALSNSYYQPQVNYDTRRNYVYSSPIHVSYTHNVPASYNGPLAPLGPDGRVIDTPEVAEAKAAHMKAHAYAASLVGQPPAYNTIY
ncbi:pupal cuticle protein-like [Leptopilina heterotoma]|uniref:pupal cuticle protein-like n=1 Tax=Leptopilina heterotoma TaxID=63436 RepID=UPI001CA7FE2A|nr:pupal cuticle protein-like [Leptopilina heterotoma]